MKRLVLSLILTLLVLAVALPAAAQDAPASCVTDLSPVAAQLMTAQALASSGDTAGSVMQLREVRAALAAIQVACAEAGVTPILLLEGEFAVVNSPYLFNYPLNWTMGTAQRPTADTLVQPMGNNSRAAGQALQAEPALAPGDQGAFVAIGNQSTFGMAADSTPAQMLESIAASLPEGYVAETVTESTINGLPAATLRYSGPTVDGYLVARIISPELGVVAQVAGITRPGELDELTPVIDAIARSMR